MRAAQAVTDRPSLICCKTIIGKGAPNKANTGAAHGAPLGEKEVAATREQHRLEIPAVRDSGTTSMRAGMRGRAAQELENAWNERSQRYAQQYPGAGRRVPSAAWRASCRAGWRAHCKAFLPR